MFTSYHDHLLNQRSSSNEVTVAAACSQSLTRVTFSGSVLPSGVRFLASAVGLDHNPHSDTCSLSLSLSLSLNLPHNSTAAILTRRSDRTGTHVSASPHNRTRTTQSRQSKSRHPPACTSTREPHLHMRTDQPPGTCRLWSVCSWRQA